MSDSNSKTKSPLHNEAVKLGKEGGKEGGPARAKALSPSERAAIARKGADAKHRKFA